MTVNNKKRFLVPTLAIVVAIPLAIGLRVANSDEGESKKESVETKAEQGNSQDADSGTAKPGSDLTPAEMVKDLRKLSDQSPVGATRDEQIASFKKIQRAIIEVARKLYVATSTGEEPNLVYAVLAVEAQLESYVVLIQIGDDVSGEDFSRLATESEKLFEASLADKDGGLDIASQAVQAVVQSLAIADQLNQKDAGQTLQSFVDKVGSDKRPKIADIGKQLQLELKLRLP
ncbi:MAG: hypothetical protein N2C12_02575, partial [Planctomycetales bacterium]